MKNTLVLALLLSVALAGCLSNNNGADSIPDPEFTFREPVALVCPDYVTYTIIETAQGRDCAGFGEPTLEIAGDGTVWYSAVCCVGQSPPIWVSHDDGLTFEALPFADGTGVVRDAAGVEGDFAIDDAGNVYFFDITAATAYFTKYSADGTHQHTKPDIFQPAVDRPWVRAGVEDEVWIFYNTIMSTILHHSTDGGLTWDFPGGTSFPCPLMTFGQGPNRDDLVVSGCPGSPGAWISVDGGQTFTDRIDLPLPENQVGTESYMQPSMDAAGYSYVPVTHTMGRDSASPSTNGLHAAITVHVIDPAGNLVSSSLATPEDGLVDKPWSIAGKDGVYAMAYYGANGVDRANEEDAVWDLKVTYTLNGHEAAPTWYTVVADEEVLKGTFGRQPGDFLQVRQTVDGGLAIAYASRDAVDQPLTNWFIRTELAPDFGPLVFRNGPQPA